MRSHSGPEVFMRVNRNYVLNEYVLNEMPFLQTSRRKREAGYYVYTFTRTSWATVYPFWDIDRHRIRLKIYCVCACVSFVFQCQDDFSLWRARRHSPQDKSFHLCTDISSGVCKSFFFNHGFVFFSVKTAPPYLPASKFVVSLKYNYVMKVARNSNEVVCASLPSSEPFKPKVHRKQRMISSANIQLRKKRLIMMVFTRTWKQFLFWLSLVLFAYLQKSVCQEVYRQPYVKEVEVCEILWNAFSHWGKSLIRTAQEMFGCFRDTYRRLDLPEHNLNRQ